MAEPPLLKSTAATNVAVKLEEMVKAQSKPLQASTFAIPSLQTVETARAGHLAKEQLPTSPSALDTATAVIDTIEQLSESTLAQTDIVLVSGTPKGSFSQELPPGFTVPQPVRPIFPGLMRAPETTFNKAEVRSTLGTNLAPRSGTLPSQPFRHDENTFGRVKSPRVTSPANATNSDIAVKSAQGITRSITPLPSSGIINLTSTFNVRPTEELRSVYAVRPISTMSENTPSLPMSTPSSSNKKQQRTYVLPDGTVTSSGKGLGRGRPGIKRGPRKSKLATEIKADSLNPTDDTVVIPPQKKRKRTASDESSGSSDPATPSEPSSRASSEEFMPENTQTRSGRKALKPSTFVPSSTTTPVVKRPGLGSAGPSAPKPAAMAKIKRKTYRGREHAALCEHCLRGHGPPGNVIVFCDACNKCWHQRCHEPQVSEDIIKDMKAEWYCTDCERIINGPKKGGKKLASKPKTSLSVSTAPVVNVPLVGASTLTREQRESQLSALSKDKLIEMLMRATDLAPALPLFENPNPPRVTTPITSGPTDTYPTPTHEEDEYDYLYDEHAALYPKPGNGVKLPSEIIDLAMLLEGPECKTFSHTLLTPAQRGLVAAAA